MTGDMLVKGMFLLCFVFAVVGFARIKIEQAWLDREAERAAYRDEIARLDAELQNAHAEQSAPSDWRAPARVVS